MTPARFFLIAGLIYSIYALVIILLGVIFGSSWLVAFGAFSGIGIQALCLVLNKISRHLEWIRTPIWVDTPSDIS